jgi:hypothetical protein
MPPGFLILGIQGNLVPPDVNRNLQDFFQGLDIFILSPAEIRKDFGIL